jgi:hypothetical protein
MARYRAKAMLFLDRLIVAGEEFESDATPGRNWEPLDDEAKAAIAAMAFEPEPRLPGSHDGKPIDIPENWRTMYKVDIVRLARRLGAPNGIKAPEAVARIEREVAARQGQMAPAI